MHSQLLCFVFVLLLGNESVVQTKYNHGKRNSSTGVRLSTTGSVRHIVDLGHSHHHLLQQPLRQLDSQQEKKLNGNFPDKTVRAKTGNVVVVYHDSDDDEAEMNVSASPLIPVEHLNLPNKPTAAGTESGPTTTITATASFSSSFAPLETAHSSMVSLLQGGVEQNNPMTESTELELFFQNDQSFSSGNGTSGTATRIKRNLKKELQIAVLAPQDSKDTKLLYSLQKILPPINMAVNSKQVKELLPGWKIEVRDRNTQCSSTYGPLAAFDFFINKTAGQFMIAEEKNATSR